MQTKDIVDAFYLFLSSLLLGQIDGPAADKLGLPAGSNAFHVDHDFFDSRQRDESDHLRTGTSMLSRQKRTETLSAIEQLRTLLKGGNWQGVRRRSDDPCHRKTPLMFLKLHINKHAIATLGRF